MKKKELSKTRQKSIKDLENQVATLMQEKAVVKASLGVGKEKNTKAAIDIKKSIAQINTILSEKRNSNQASKEVEKSK